jgi:hypothetical protein
VITLEKDEEHRVYYCTDKCDKHSVHYSTAKCDMLDCVRWTCWCGNLQRTAPFSCRGKMTRDWQRRWKIDIESKLMKKAARYIQATCTLLLGIKPWGSTRWVLLRMPFVNKMNKRDPFMPNIQISQLAQKKNH